MDLYMNVSKAQAQTIAKNTRKNQNKQIQINATHRFLHQKKQALTGATKSIKKLTNTTNQVVVTKMMHDKTTDHNKKQNPSREIEKSEEVTPRKTCNKQKSEK